MRMELQAFLLLMLAAAVILQGRALTTTPCPAGLNGQCACNSTFDLVSIACRFEPGVHLAPILNSSQTSPPLQLLLLDLVSSYLTTVPDNFLDPFSAIHTLDLSYNNLTSLPPAVRGHGNVSLVKLTHAALEQFNFSGLSSTLTSLDLSFNHIETLHFDPKKEPKLHHLDLSNNALEAIPSQVYRAAIYLNFSSNKLSNLSEIQDSEALYLDLSGNQLTRLPSHTLHGLHMLDELNLSHNQLTSLEAESLSGLVSLTFLNLANNKLTSLPEELFQQTPLLLKLDLSGNLLRQLDLAAFSALPILQHLSLGNNLVSSLHPDVFLQLVNLRQLDLSNNVQLGNMAPVEFPAHISFLDLSNCSITSVDECKFIKFLDIQHLDLSGNPLRCNCHLLWMAKWLAGRSMRTLPGYRLVDNIPWTCLDGNGTTQTLTATSNVSSDLCGDHTVASHHCNSRSSSPRLFPKDIDVNLTLAIEGNSVTVSWEVKVNGSIHGYRLMFDIEGEHSTFNSPILEPTEKSFVMKDMQMNKDFTVCLEILVNSSTTVKSICSNHTAVSLKLVIGILAGVIFLVPCSAILGYIIYKDRQLTQEEYMALEECKIPDCQEPTADNLPASSLPGKESCLTEEGELEEACAFSTKNQALYHPAEVPAASTDQSHINLAFQKEQQQPQQPQEKSEEVEVIRQADSDQDTHL